MQRTLFLAFLALSLGAIAFAQDSRGQNKDHGHQAPPRQERNTPPPPQRRNDDQRGRQPEQRRQDRPAPPPKQERRDSPPPQERRNTPPPPQRRDDDQRGRQPDQRRQDNPPPRREDRTPPPQQARRDTPPPAPKRDDDRHGIPEQNRRDNTPPRRQDDNQRGVQPKRDDDRRSPNDPQRGKGTAPRVDNPTDRDANKRGLPGGLTRGVGGQPDFNRGGHNISVDRSRDRVSFDPPPAMVNNRVTYKAWREDRTVRSVHYRNGYYHYNSGWRDSDFWYPNYVYVYGDGCVPSPWYWYPHLPAYVSWNRCRPTIAVVFNFSFGDRYDYRPYYDRFDSGRLDSVADRLEDAFRSRNYDRMSWLVDRDSWVQIQVTNADTYDMRGDDFGEMVRDLVEGTHTISYKIVDVRKWDDNASIVARHTYVDSWGHREVVEHSYGLQRYRDGWKIVSFRSDED